MLIEKVVIGTWPLSGDYGKVSLKTVEASLIACYENNFKEFDTAPSYGNGFIEFCLGKVLGSKNDVLFNTKVGNVPFKGKSFKVADLQTSFDQSLKRLGVDSINILFLHNPRDDINNYEEVLKFMSRLKQKGLIRYSGISLAKNFNYDAQFLKEFDVIQDDGNLLDMRFLDLNISKNSKFMARSPLASGILSGKITKESTFPLDDHRSGWLKGERLESIMKRVSKINEVSNIELIDLAKFFILSNNKVDKVIFGIKKKDHINSILMIDEPILINRSIEEKLIELYRTDFGLIGEDHLAL